MIVTLFTTTSCAVVLEAWYKKNFVVHACKMMLSLPRLSTRLRVDLAEYMFFGSSSAVNDDLIGFIESEIVVIHQVTIRCFQIHITSI